MSFVILKNKIEDILKDTKYQFKESLTNDTIVKFSTKEPKDWTTANLKSFIDKHYKNMELYCKSHCKQDELYTAEEINTLEEYLNKFLDEY